LFGCETDAVALDANTPVSVGERGALDGSADGDGYDALVSLDELYFARGELMSEADKLWTAMLWRGRCLSPQSGTEEGTDRLEGEREEHVGLCNCLVRLHPRDPFHARLSLALTVRFLFILHFEIMSDRKRALEESGPSFSAKKARRFVFAAFDCPDFPVLTLSFNSETTVSTLSPPFPR